MTRQWQPGDVAMVNDATGLSEDQPATCVAAAIKGKREAEWVLHGSGACVWSSVSKARPLVLIDPENREQVERLAVAYATVESARMGDEYRAWENRSAEARGRIVASLAAALREFADPTPPKPDEPTGDGAVVEDSNGHRWVRIAAQGETPDSPPWRHRGHTARRWESVNAVRVLSEGVIA